jgi:uncharacterized membrane protein YbhN (UPF0104 family)
LGLAAILLSLRRGLGIGFLGRLLSRMRLQRVGRFIISLAAALQSDLGERQFLAQGMGLSVLVNACVMSASFLVTVATAGAVSFWSFMALATLIVALQGIPITPGAIGIREGLHVFFLGLLGVTGPKALSVGLLVTGLNCLQGLLGGLLLVVKGLPEIPTADAVERQL